MNFTILPQKEKKQATQQDYRILSYVLAFLIPLMTLLVIMQYFGFAPFGEKNLFVSQGAFYNMTILTDTIHSIRNGSFHWLTLSSGTGLEYYSTFAYYLCSPFTLICLLFPQNVAVSLLSVFTILRISASAPIFMYYLSHKELGYRCEKETFDPSLLLFGLGYALSSYALVQYNDFMFLDIFMLFPLLMLGLERLICKKGNRLFYIVLSVCLFSNFYLGLILLPFMLVYLILKSNQNLTELLKSILRFVGYSLLAVCTSAITVFPGMAGMYRSMISTTQVSPATNVQDYFTFFYQHLFYNYPSYLKQAYWGYNLYVGLAALMLAVLYFFAKKIRWQERLRSFFLVLLTILTLQFHPFAYMMHLKNGAATYYNCYAFLYLFLLLLLAFEGLHHLMDVHPVLFGIGLLLPIAFTFVSIAISTTAPNFSSVQASAGIMIFYAILLVLNRKKSIQKKTLFSFLVVCGALELMANAFQNSTFIAQSSAPVEKCMVTAASGMTDDNTLPLRSEVLYGTRQYRATTYGLNSRYSINPFLTEQEAQIFSPLADAMACMQSLYVRKGSDDIVPNDLQYYKSGSNHEYDIYDNKYCLPTAFFINNTSVAESSVSHSTFFDQQNSIANLLGMPDNLYEETDITFSVFGEGDTTIKYLGNNIYSFHTDADSKDSSASAISFNVKFTPVKSGDLYIFIRNLIHFGEVEAGKEYTYTLTMPPALLDDSIYWIQSAYFSHENMSKLADDLSLSKVDFRQTGSIISTQYDASSDGCIITYLPFQNSYHITINGEAITANSLNDQLIIPVKKGTNQIVISYEYMPFYYGIWLSALTVLFVFVLSKFLKKMTMNISFSALSMQTILQTCSDLCRDNYVYLLSILIPFMLFTAHMIYMGCEPFGHIISIFSGDAIHSAFPANAEADYLSFHNWPSHSWNGGGGYNILTLFSGIHLPSISWYTVPYSQIIGYNTISIVITISLCGATMIYYLTHRLNGKQACKKDPRLLIASLTYCLCNYFLIMLNNTSWYIAFLLLPLLILQMDYLMVKGQKRGYIIVLSLAVLNNYYILMFICIYMVFRFFTYQFDSLLDFIKKGIRFALCSLCIIGPAYNTLFYATTTLSNSTYSEVDSNTAQATKTFLFNGFEFIFNRQEIFAKTLGISWNEGDVNLYFGLLSLLLIFIYLFSSGITRSEKLRQLMPYAFFFIALNQPLFNYVVNGFHYQHGVPNRFAFLLPFMAAGISYDAMVALRKQNWKQIVLPALMLTSIFAVSYYFTEADEKNSPALIASLIFLAIYTGFLLLIRYCKKSRRTPIILVTIIFVVEIGMNGLYQLYNSYGFAHQIYYTEEAANLLKNEYNADNELFRTTIPNPRCTNYPFANTLKSCAIFTGGTITGYQIKFADYNGLSTQSNALQTTDSQTLMGNALSYNKFIMINSPCETEHLRDLKYYKPVAYTQNAIILENDYTFPFGYYLPKEVTTYDYRKVEDTTEDDTALFWNTITKSILKKDSNLMDSILVCNKLLIPEVTTNYLEKEVVSDDEKYFNCTVTMPVSGALYTRISDFQYIGDYEKDETVSFRLDVSNYSDSDPKAATNMFVFHDDVFFELEEAINKHPFHVTSFTDDMVAGTIDMPEDGILNFSMPYDRQWQVTVDGKPVETHALADAYLYIELPKGQHTVEMNYVDNRWVFARNITVGSWILLALAIMLKDFYMWQKRKAHK